MIPTLIVHLYLRWLFACIHPLFQTRETSRNKSLGTIFLRHFPMKAKCVLSQVVAHAQGPAASTIWWIVVLPIRVSFSAIRSPELLLISFGRRDSTAVKGLKRSGWFSNEPIRPSKCSGQRSRRSDDFRVGVWIHIEHNIPGFKYSFPCFYLLDSRLSVSSSLECKQYVFPTIPQGFSDACLSPGSHR